jgi:hypothetical protein
MSWIKGIKSKLKMRYCKHAFDIADLKKTGIPEPNPPGKQARPQDHLRYWATIHKHPSHTQRVEWACFKCGKVFRDHCGLDISPKNGWIASKPINQPSKKP